MRFLLGGYTADKDGVATGIGMLRAGADSDHLAGGPLSFAGGIVRADSPSWVAWHPSLDVVYAALEGRGAVQAFARTGEAAFRPLGDAVAAGDAVCHVAVAPDGGSLVASCWGDGRVVRMTLDAAGRPSDPVAAPPAADPHGSDRGDGAEPGLGGAGSGLDLAAAARALRAAAGEEYAHLVPAHDRDDVDGRDAGASLGAAIDADAAASAPRPSRAHQARFLDGGLIATTDLGLDLVRFWRATPAGLRPAGEVVLPRGSGPRHTVWHPSGHLYVVTELSCEVFVLAPEASGAWRVVAGAPLGVLAGDAAAELAMSRDGHHLYAAARGSDTLATLRVRGDGSTLQPVALVESGVRWPRHHLVVRDTLLVAGQRSDDVVSLTLDERTGVPGRVRHRAEAPSPACLVPLR